MKKIFYLLLSLISVNAFAQPDASAVKISHPPISCYGQPQIIYVDVKNNGSTPFLKNALALTLKIGGANQYVNTLYNANVVAPGATTTFTFLGIGLNNAGKNIDTAIAIVAGDINPTNDTLISGTTTSTTLSNYPIIEDFENIEEPFVFPYVEIVSGPDQLWKLQTGPYSNPIQPTPLNPLPTGNKFYLFDSYNASQSVSRIYSKCIEMPAIGQGLTYIDFFMSHDDYSSLGELEDSLYLVISTDKGNTWTRLSGYQRYDDAYAVPGWKKEIVDISSYNGDIIQLGFEGVSRSGNSIGLDNINIRYTGPVSVSLLKFDAKRSGTVNNLQWTTSKELNTNSFIIERSTDGRNYKKIGEVAAQGNTITTSNYLFSDVAPVKGNNYYRLRLVDKDNSFRLSHVKNVRNVGFAEMMVAPNPVAEIMKLRLDAEKTERATLTITDLSGKRVFQKSLNVIAGANQMDIPVNYVSRGTYVVTLQLSEQTIIKQISKR